MAIYDSKTTNISFLKMYKTLKLLGIKNNKFFLILYDKKLQGVDPFDEKNLTEKQKLRIKCEIRRNPWYFLREIIRIPVPGGLKRYELHRGNLALSYCMFNCFNSITLMPRQHGKTVGCLCNYEWIYDFGTENSTILFMNKAFPDSKRNLKIMKDIREKLPSYLLEKDKRDVDNLEIITKYENNNTIRALASATSEDEADKKGRGITSPLQMWDEVAFLKHNKIMYGERYLCRIKISLIAGNSLVINY